ncbi:hypothetical protein CVT24_002241 [Panaeolus cyanescens]|uniref:Uncharacterized protein n=1 Tax=Panaeolus cyanescens TaxID=181874 RepID=A0A409YIC5_9AGAR|nr:hypothetical protein CVT24_002241 [Panaeolus cyanescens]
MLRLRQDPPPGVQQEATRLLNKANAPASSPAQATTSPPSAQAPNTPASKGPTPPSKAPKRAPRVPINLAIRIVKDVRISILILIRVRGIEMGVKRLQDNGRLRRRQTKKPTAHVLLQHHIPSPVKRQKSGISSVSHGVSEGDKKRALSSFSLVMRRRKRRFLSVWMWSLTWSRAEGAFGNRVMGHQVRMEGGIVVRSLMWSRCRVKAASVLLVSLFFP